MTVYYTMRFKDKIIFSILRRSLALIKWNKYLIGSIFLTQIIINLF